MIDEAEFPRLLAAAQRGDELAVATLFRELHPAVLRFVRAQEHRDADDLMGEVWLAVARGLASFEGDRAGFRAWVFSIARRRIADHRRRGVRRSGAIAPEAALEEVVAPGADPESLAVDRLSGQQAADLIVSMLSHDQAEVVLLRVLAGLDVEQVAEILGRSPNWVRVTQHRALRKLAERLGSKVDVIR